MDDFFLSTFIFFLPAGGRCRSLSIGQGCRAGGGVSDAFQCYSSPTSGVVFRSVRGSNCEKHLSGVTPTTQSTHAATSRRRKRRGLCTPAPQEMTSLNGGGGGGGVPGNESITSYIERNLRQFACNRPPPPTTTTTSAPHPPVVPDV